MADEKICEICGNAFDADREGGTIPERKSNRKIKMVVKCQKCLDKTHINDN